MLFVYFSKIVKQFPTAQTIVYKYVSHHSLKPDDIQFSTHVQHHVQKKDVQE